MKSNYEYTTDEFQEAKKAVEERIGFYIHLTVYIVANLFLHYWNYRDGGFYWAFWPTIGWGIGLLFHGVSVWGYFNNGSWKRKMIQKELEKQRKNQLVE